MSQADTHLVLAVRDGVAELAAEPFLSWHDAQAKWQLLDDERLASKPRPAMSQLYYMVRSSNDPSYTHLLPVLYAGREAAAKALGRRVMPGKTSRQQHWYLCEMLGCDKRGWWHTANAARRAGYLDLAPLDRAYLTTRTDTLYPRSK
jgi:hypothetical protein